MKRVYILISVCFLFCSYNFQYAYASRSSSPAAIPDVYYDNLRITADNFDIDNMGVVQAFDSETNELIWRTKVYNVIIDPHIEADTQYVFFKSMNIEDDKLIIVNEKNEKFILNPHTGKPNNYYKKIVLFGSIAVISLIVIIILVYVIIKKRINLSGVYDE